MSSVFNSISKYAVSGKASDEAYADLRDVAVEAFEGAVEPEDRALLFADLVSPGEDEFMRVNYDANPDARHAKGKRKGQWKYRTFLPHAYNTAKSALTSGLAAGVDPTGLGKTDLEKQTKQVVTTKKSPVALLTDAVDLYFKRYAKVTAQEQYESVQLVLERFNKAGVSLDYK